MSERESMPVDVVVVGGGVAGLAAAIRLKQVNEELEVLVLEKGSEIGAHILSGAVVDPKALQELFPDWRSMDCPMAETPVTDNWHWMLSKGGKVSVPHIALPPFMSNDGCYTGSLGNLTRWLGEQAEALGVMVFPGFPASEVMFNDADSVIGVITQDMGVAADGSHKPDYQPGMEIHAKYTLFAEGARGNLTKQMKDPLRSGSGMSATGLRPWVSRNCGTLILPSMSRAVSSTRKAGRFPKAIPGAVVSFTISERTGRNRLRNGARLREPIRLTISGISAVEAPSGDC